MPKICTYVRAEHHVKDILESVLGQMSDGIWENTRSMERYWKSLDVSIGSDGFIYIEDKHFVCSDPVDFLANKIKQIVKIEADDNPGDHLEWDRMNATRTDYISTYDSDAHGAITVGECYMLYEALKGRNIYKHQYAIEQKYEVNFEDNTGSDYDRTVTVFAISPYEAEKKAKDWFIQGFKVHTKVA